MVSLTTALAVAVIGGSQYVGAAPTSLKSLNQAFLRAAQEIRRHQNPDGSWATLSTPHPQFQAPFSPHVNVFVPSLIVDLLEPVAHDAGLTDVVDRGRSFLRQQIEDTGLVRYMGKRGQPGQPGVAPPGCETPADSDDTALVWRLAPGHDATLLQSARRVLEHYRTADGLYKTWLADEDAHRCFHTKYPGQEPNPADVGIQMHLYLFFVQHDREAAHKLCTALRPRIGDERIWVWYTMAPLVPLLREAELTRAGCSIRVPDARVRRAPPGQQPYIRLGQRLAEILLGQEPRDIGKSLETLGSFAGENLTRIEKSPPLLYHNDLSWPSSEAGYYWSEEVGYALWLRTYVELARRQPGRLSLPGRSGRPS